MVQATAAAPSMPIAPPRLTVFDTGAEQCPQGQLPGAGEMTEAEGANVRNPLQYVPVVGMIYRQATGEKIPPAFAIAGSVASSAALGGPIGILGSVAMNFLIELASLRPDTSRPPVPEGMDVTGAEAGLRPISPGGITTPGGYTTLASVTPDFLGGAAMPGSEDGPVPEGMDVTGAEAGLRPISPGSITTPGGYTTLASVTPDFLGGAAMPGNEDGPVRQAVAAYTAGSMTGMG